MFDYKYLWLIMAAVLAVLEINTTTLVCLWFVIGSVFAFAAGFVTDSFAAQLAVFAVTSAIALALTRSLAKKVFTRRPTPTNFDRLIGRERTVTREIPAGGRGRVEVDGLSWLARSESRAQKGDKVRIQTISGATLIVTPEEKNKD